jgi:pimeloyl-ACP methyl ester carboxylesterase
VSETPVAERRSRLKSALAIAALRDEPFWGKSWRRRLLRFPLFVVYAIALTTLLLMPFENRLAHPGATFAGAWHEPPTQLGVEEVSLSSRTGDTIHAWFTAPEGWRPEQGAILYSHGNGGNLSGRQGTLGRWRNELGRAVLIYDYPGYGRSTGSPTEAGCYAAIDAAHDWLLHEKKVPAGEVILLGSSMGGAFATDLAARRECRMLVLVNSFTSFPDVAQERFPFLPARYVVSNRLDNESKIGEVSAPVFVTHGREDGVVPFWMGERLYEKANQPKRFFPIDGHPHQQPQQPEFFAAVRAFLKQTQAN